ncbi:MAG: amino acid adenylation domain-containing protein, partial [Candidatus Aminicenantes bacterium]
MEMRVSKDKLAVAAEQNVTERDYWQNLLSGEGDFIKSTFPYDYQEKKPGEYSPDRLKFHFSPGLFSKVMELSKGVEVKLHMLLVTGLFILLNKYMSGNKDIMIGSPILKQDIEGEFINTVLVFRTPVEDHASFKELLLQIRETIIKANENQNYPLELLLERLDIPEREEKFSLFDVGLLLENIHDKRYLQGIDYSMLFSFLKTREHIKGVVEYNSLLYRQDTVKRIISHYMRVMEQGLEDVNQKLTHLQLLSETERQQVLVDFNNTKVQYPQDRVLDELFEEQVESTPNHVAVVGQNSSSGVGTRFVTSVTYKELNRQSNQLADLLRKKGIKPDTIVGIIVEPSLEMMVGILGILKAGGAYLPLDLDYPEERIRYMLRDANVKFLVTTPDLGEKFDKLLIVNCELLMVNEKHPYGRRPNNPPQETINNLQLKHASLAYIIYTSGSTGKPKGVMVEHGNVVCYLNAFYLEFNIQAMDTGIQLAPFSFDVYIEEMFPILLKGGRFIIPDASRMMDMDWLTRLIVKHGVSIIDCTPLLLNEINKCELETTEITFISGGDVLKKEYIDKLLKVGPVYNTYGPTETTVCASYFQCNRSGPDMIPPIPIGKPIANYNIYILDSYHQPVPIGVCGELFISGPGVTRGYLNQPELTAEKFVLAHNSRLTAERETMKAAINYNYKTGDLGRWLSDGNIQFLNRKDLQVKIRGYRVETAEIEKRLSVHAGIKEVVVVAREDSDGDRYLCAYIIPAGEIEFSGLKESLASELPHYMIPSFFVSMSQLPLTSTGKIDRKALPEPKIDARAAYVHPQNQIQKQMQKIWQKVLGLESIGIYDNFFNIGGHSLKGIQVINGIHREFNVKIPLAEMFRTPTIKGLSGYIETTAKDKFVSLEPVEEKEYYALSSAQKRLYILQELESESTAYNMPQVTTVKLKIEKGKPEQSFRKLIHRHESLRTSFDMINQQPVQRIYPSRQLEFEIKYFDLPGTQVEVKVKVEEEAAPCGHVLNAFAGHYPRSQELRVKSIISSFIRPFDLRQAPLLRVGIIKTGEKKYILMTDMHHIVSDGVSYGILTGDFIRLYPGEDLAPLRLQYKDFSEWQQCEKQKELTKQQELYWMKIFSGQLPLLNLPIDYPRPLLQSFEGSSVSFALNEKEVRTLKEINKETGTTLYMFILAIYNILLCKLSGQEDIIIGTPIAARRHKELERVIGMFANTLAMRNYPWGEKSFNQFLIEVKERTLEAFENQEYPFEELVEKVWAARDTSRNPLFDVMLVMQNLQQPESTTDLLAAEALPKQSDRYQHESSISKFDLTLT